MGSSTQPVGASSGQVVDKLTENISRQLLPEMPKKRIISTSTGGVGDQFALLRPSKSETRLKPKFFSIFWTHKPTSQAEEGPIQAPEIPKDPVTVFQEEVKKHVKDVLYTAFWENKIPCSSQELESLEKEIIFQIEVNPQFLSDLWVSPNDWREIYLGLTQPSKNIVLKLGLDTEFDFCALMGPVEADRKNLNEAQLEQIYNDVQKADPETQAAFFSDVLPSMDVEAGAEVVLKMVKNKSLIGDAIYNQDVIKILSSSVHFKEIYQLDLLLNGPGNFFRHPELCRFYSQSSVEDALRVTAFPGLDFDSGLKNFGLSKNEKLKQKLIKTSYDPEKIVKDVVAQALKFRHKDQQPWEEIWEGFMKDPAFVWVSLIQPQWMDEFFPGPDQTREESQAVLLVARFLKDNKSAVNEKTVKEAYRCILEMKELTYEIPLFEGRHVLVIACDEKDKSGKNIFGNERSLSTFKAKGALSQDLMRLSDPEFAFMNLEQKLDLIKNILIQAHIMEKLSSTLDSIGVASPLMTGPSEYGQVDWTNSNLVSNSTFLSLLLSKERPVFGHTTELDYNTNLHTNPSIFMTVLMNGVLRTIQIAENKKEKSSSKPV